MRFLPFCALCAALACASAPAGSRAARQDADVTAADIQSHPDEPIEKILERKVPGLIVTRTSSGGVALRIRGSTPFGPNTADTSRIRGGGYETGVPLYVVDGSPISTGPEGAVPGLNANDIDSIKILRGAEAAVYGINGANGVISIKTKRAAKKP